MENKTSLPYRSIHLGLKVKKLSIRLTCLILDDEEDDQEEVSEEDVEPEVPAKTKKPKPPQLALQAKKSKQVDISKLPLLDNNGLSYLPKMQYFPLGELCPMTLVNSVSGDQLLALIHLPSGGFNCIAIPMGAVEKDDKA